MRMVFLLQGKNSDRAKSICFAGIAKLDTIA
ncbi:hypothetical protein CBM2609_A60106 [Cupriavidus taiwanensis]|nr:hypothetical protein CBM2604_A50105 [Cupriavidus taiwanensis]SOZ27509.1 hypothetical protein CBM2609_A60106 [Cupriavidus taiwanensis]SOZ45836.1 hypothetical protein CBM2610_A70104 [Cupriavidus taiwanensis]